MTAIYATVVWNATHKSYQTKRVWILGEGRIAHNMLSKQMKVELRQWIWFFNIHCPKGKPQTFRLN